jgi:hypothetical protein
MQSSTRKITILGQGEDFSEIKKGNELKLKIFSLG